MPNLVKDLNKGCHCERPQGARQSPPSSDVARIGEIATSPSAPRKDTLFNQIWYYIRSVTLWCTAHRRWVNRPAFCLTFVWQKAVPPVIPAKAGTGGTGSERAQPSEQTGRLNNAMHHKVTEQVLHDTPSKSAHGFSNKTHRTGKASALRPFIGRRPALFQ